MYYFGIDVGGTFTDVVIMDADGKLQVFKAESTPKDPSIGVLDGIRLAAEGLGLSEERLLNETALIAHGTTVATNTLLERKGAKVGLITTKGFGDTIFIQRMMGLTAGLTDEEIRDFASKSLAEPLVLPAFVKEVTERVDYKGAEIVPLNEKEVGKALNELLSLGVEAIAVCFLWSFRNPNHEKKVKEMIAKTAPTLPVSISCEVMPVIKEYERTVTTVFNAYLTPSVGKYMGNLSNALKAKGLKGYLSILAASGGIFMPEEAMEKAALLVTSGPCGGVTSSLFLGEALGYKNIITTDVGGTSFDTSLIIDGRPSLAVTKEVAKYLAHIPMLDIETLGAGGGSIARLERGKLKVGPQSAGADPGPVCYGKGGIEPTVTDADVVLGLIDPDYFLGGRVKLNKDLAEQVIYEKIAKPLGMDVIQAAAGIKRVMDNMMADVLRTITIKKGNDPRDFVLFAFGGAGPTHCSAYGAELAVKAIVVPFTAGVHSAFGAVGADLLNVFELTDVMKTPLNFDVASKYLDCERLNRNFETLEDQGREVLKREGIAEKDMVFRRSVDFRYRRQTHEIFTPVSSGKLKPEDIDKIAGTFEKTYEDTYGKGTAYREAGIEITIFRVEARGKMPKPKLRAYPPATEDVSKAHIGERRVYFYEIGDFADTKIFDGLKIGPGHIFHGPTIIQHPETTIVIGPKQKGTVDRYLNIVIESK